MGSVVRIAVSSTYTVLARKDHELAQCSLQLRTRELFILGDNGTEMTAPNLSAAKGLLDFTVNMPTIISIFVLLFSAAYGLSKFETRVDHDIDIKATQQFFVHQDVEAVNQRALSEWREEIRQAVKSQAEQMDRIEKKLDQSERAERIRRE